MSNSSNALSEYIRVSRYAKYLKKEKRYETWPEQVRRVMNLHREKYKDTLDNNVELQKIFIEVEESYLNQDFLGSMRILQFAGDPNNEGFEDPVLKHQARVYNCVTTAIDGVKKFGDIMYLLLCGCGVGFSVQDCHASKLPAIRSLRNEVVNFVVEDTIEGWADAIYVLMASYFRDSQNDRFQKFYGKKIEFDFSKIRPKGAPISGGFLAPGPDGLIKAINKIKTVIETRLASTGFVKDPYQYMLEPIDIYDILMHASDAVLSGGVRRSATICLFSFTDQKMLNAKTGDWYINNPQRGRSNNSAMLLRNKVTIEEFREVMESVKQFGEPGFIWTDSEDDLYNPCVEIGMRPFFNEQSGIQGCNLCEINGKQMTTKEIFLQTCRTAAIMGTLQAGYTDFKYLDEISKFIFEREALLGVSITGIMDNPDICLNPDILEEGAKVMLEVNEYVADLININPAARIGCIKPAGSTSALLNTSSGIHGHHAKRYIRHTQVNKEEQLGQIYKQVNPAAVEESVWSANKTDNVIAFLVESSPRAILKEDLLDTKQLDAVKLLQQHWVVPSTRLSNCTSETTKHNVSNTVSVTNWEAVTDYIFENKNYLAGISFISHTGDKDYPQAPFTAVPTEEEIIELYGIGAMFASGLIVDGLEAFEGHLWNAIDTAMKIAEPTKYFGGVEINNTVHNHILKMDWCKRFAKFADKYCGGDLLKCNYLLKDINNLHKWESIQRTYTPINWAEQNLTERLIEADTLGAIACSGGSCEIL